MRAHCAGRLAARLVERASSPRCGPYLHARAARGGSQARPERGRGASRAPPRAESRERPMGAAAVRAGGGARRVGARAHVL